MSISGLQNDHGVVRLVLCPAGHPFPDCGHAGIAQVVPIKNRVATASFREIISGPYAIAVFHDQNNNGRLDTFLGIPREGFGFSRNASPFARAPHFSECAINVATDIVMAIKMRYLF